MGNDRPEALKGTFAQGETSDPRGFASRLRTALAGRTVQWLADEAGISYSTVRKYLDGSSPTVDKAAALARSLGCSLDWLASGEPSIPGQFQSILDTPHFRESSDSRREDVGLERFNFTFVPRLDDAIRGSSSTPNVRRYVADILAFRSEWLHERGVDPASARLHVVSDDAMEPTLRPGDVVLVDTSKARVVDAGIYAIVAVGYTQLRRVRPRRDGTLQLVPDNPARPIEDLSAEDAADAVAGRVMWFGRSI